MFFYRYASESTKYASVPNRPLPAPEDRAPALAIVEWAAEDPEAELLDAAAVKELRLVTDREPWCRDSRAWSVVFHLALQVWAMGYARFQARQRVEEKKSRAPRNLF